MNPRPAGPPNGRRGAAKGLLMAMLLSVALFAGWAAVGLAALNAGRFRGATRKLLLAPGIGFAACGVLAYLAVRAGFPVARSGAAVGLGAALAALTALWLTRVPLSRAARAGRRFAPFAVVLVGTFVLTGWPLFRYGFDWVANGNDDMANYCVGAIGFVSHGYLAVPTPEELNGGSDMSQQLWSLYFDPGTMTQKRCGSELTLALVAVWTGLTPQQAFMPVIVALNAALVGATAGLVLLSTRRRAAALAAGALLTVSSQIGYGVVQQLIAQAGGLALLCTSVALVSAPFRRFRAGVVARRAAVCGLVFAGLVLFYPEVVPFLVGACVLLGARDIARRNVDRRHLGHAATAIGVMALLLPVYLYGTAHFLLGQADQGTGAATHTLEIFPYYMTPRGAALVAGLLPTHADLPEPWHSVVLALGPIFFAAFVLVALGQFRRGRPFAAVLLVMVALGVALYAQKAAFGLFKIAMFAQPFIWATVAAWAASRRRRWAVAGVAGLLVAVAGLNASTQQWYVKRSTGQDGRVDLPVVTQRRVLTDFRAAVAPGVASGQVRRVLVATENNVLLKLLGAELCRVPNTQMTMAPFHRFLPPDEARKRPPRPVAPAPGVRAQESMWLRPDLPWVLDPDTGRPLHQLLSAPNQWTHDDPDRVLVVAGVGPLSVLNRTAHPEGGPALLCAPLSTVRNFAVFRDATEARQSFLGMDDIREVALYQLEPDPLFRKRSMAGVGRHLVVDVLNPAPRVRVLVDCTGSFAATDRAVPPAAVVGDRRVAVGAVGVGAARLVSPPLTPQAIGPSRVLALDFGTARGRHPNQLRGLEALWGADLPRDRRMLTGHLRNLSVLSDDEYAAFAPPDQLTRFPADLEHRHLEFSGICEDGWVGTTFKVRLTQPAPGQEAVIRGQIPMFPDSPEFRTTAVVRVDGREVESRDLGPGDFEVRAPAGAAQGPRWVEVTFSAAQTMPPPDGRRLVARLLFIGFEPRDEAKSRPPERVQAFPADVRHPKADARGVFEDGWCAGAFAVRLWQPGPVADVVIRGQVPEGDGLRTEVQVLVDGTEVARKGLGPGAFEVRAPAPGGAAQARRLECRFTHTQALPAPDGRRVGAHLRFVGFEPPAPGR